jgi:hypothetical protein
LEEKNFKKCTGIATMLRSTIQNKAGKKKLGETQRKNFKRIQSRQNVKLNEKREEKDDKGSLRQTEDTQRQMLWEKISLCDCDAAKKK